VLAIDELDLDAGERLAVLGPNGAGKTTLLRLLAGLDSPGSVELDGVPLAAAGREWRRRIAYATQQPGLLSTTVLRNVELPLRWRGIARDERRAAALAALERLGAGRLAGRKAPTLSGGEAQRVNLARALALEPLLLLLDEPAARLDPDARQSFFADLETALADRRATVVHVSHRADEAFRLADRVAVLSEGRVVQAGPPGEVLVGGRACGLRQPGIAGGATLAAWASAVELVAPGAAPLEAKVEHVSPGPGRWDVSLACAESLAPNCHSTSRRRSPATAWRCGSARNSPRSSHRRRFGPLLAATARAEAHSSWIHPLLWGQPRTNARRGTPNRRGRDQPSPTRYVVCACGSLAKASTFAGSMRNTAAASSPAPNTPSPTSKCQTLPYLAS
jgi:ABC-type nitrate/sulfonate/bicarbonate transport system ATPase subunit